MSTLKVSHPIALSFLMTDDLYRLKDDELTENSISQELSALVEEAVHKTAAITDPDISSIVETTEASTESDTLKEELTFFEYLGENNKYILILVNEPAHKMINPKESETLVNILKGKQQEIKDIALVNFNKYPSATYSALKSFFACNSIILFGINPAQIGIEEVQSNQITTFQGTKILATSSISEMLNDINKKRAFWDEMKKL